MSKQFNTTALDEFERLVRAEDVAPILDVKPWRIYQLVREKQIPPGVVVRVGPRTVRFSPSGFRRWVAEGGYKGTG